MEEIIVQGQIAEVTMDKNLHKESSLLIYHTTEYGAFRMINGNRELNAAKIKRIQKDIAAGLDVLKYCPILVKSDGKKLEIIDGQHRFWVAKELKKPVHYLIVEKNIDLYSIAKINSNTETWKGKDFINCYAQQGNKDYLILQAFVDEWGFNIGMSINLLANGNTPDGSQALDAFKAGQFKVKKLNDAIELAKICKQFSKFNAWRSRPFVVAISKILKGAKCDVKELVEKFNKDTESLQIQGTYKEYLVNLEAIYNKGTHKRRVIY